MKKSISLIAALGLSFSLLAEDPGQFYDPNQPPAYQEPLPQEYAPPQADQYYDPQYANQPVPQGDYAPLPAEQQIPAELDPSNAAPPSADQYGYSEEIAPQAPEITDRAPAASELGIEERAVAESEEAGKADDTKESTGLEMPPEEQALRESYFVPEVAISDALGNRVYPASTSNSPTAFGSEWGDLFLGVSYQAHTRQSPNPDGAVSTGFGLGNAARQLGFETVVTVVDLLGDTGADGTVSFKIHRSFVGGFAIAVGVENVLTWGLPDGGTSYYGVGTYVWNLKKNHDAYFSILTISAGVGNGRFRLVKDVVADKKTFNPFISAGLQIARPFAFIVDWTGQDLNVGLSIIPFPTIPVSAMVAMAEVLRISGGGPRYIAGLALNVSFLDEWQI